MLKAQQVLRSRGTPNKKKSAMEIMRGNKYRYLFIFRGGCFKEKIVKGRQLLKGGFFFFFFSFFLVGRAKKVKGN